jgi:hypothetical protein
MTAPVRSLPSELQAYLLIAETNAGRPLMRLAQFRPQILLTGHPGRDGNALSYTTANANPLRGGKTISSRRQDCTLRTFTADCELIRRRKNMLRPKRRAASGASIERGEYRSRRSEALGLSLTECRRLLRHFDSCRILHVRRKMTKPAALADGGIDGDSARKRAG